MGVLFGDEANDFQPVAIRQSHVGQAELELAFAKAGPRLGHSAGTGGSEPHARQRQVDQFTDIRLVIDDQHAAQLAARAPVASGN